MGYVVLDLRDTAYEGSVSRLYVGKQTPRRTRGKERGNKVRKPSYSGHAREVLLQLRNIQGVPCGRYKSTVKISPRERAIIEDLQGKRLRALQIAGNIGNNNH